MEYVAFDLETTGIAYEESRIIEIGAARYVDDKIVDRFDTFCSVAEPLNPFIVKLTHITDEMLKDKDTEENVKGCTLRGGSNKKIHRFCRRLQNIYGT